MSTKQTYKWSEIKNTSPYFSMIRTTIETAVYRNNVYPVETLQEAYKLACDSPGTIITDIPIYEPQKVGLSGDSKVLVFNDGGVKGRCAAARRIIGEPDVDIEEYAIKIRNAIYDTRYQTMYHAQAYVGLSKNFMTKAHLLIPQDQENVLYSWLLNFQYITEEYYKMYQDSTEIPNEGDIYIFSDPNWSHPDHPLGLTFFDPENNCAVILGMRYFGEHKKGTLTLAWSIANRNGYAACHGGQKRYTLKDGSTFVVGVFGLSGSGKSTITHAKHGGKYDITVLHDDAFIINTKDMSSTALEPSYFDKTQDYPMDDPDNKYLLCVQNNGVTLDEDGNKVLVTQDIRNGNGRAVKSILWTKNRENYFSQPANAIIWLMKDPTLPPVIKVTDPILAATMGATLATKRTSAERLAEGVDPNALIVEPYANPFRTYPLINDYKTFKHLFKDKGVDCYIFNTGYFMGKDVTPAITISALEAIAENTATFVSMGVDGLEYLPFKGFDLDFTDADYKQQFIARLKDRISFIQDKNTTKGGYDQLPNECILSIHNIEVQAENL